jgi:hypothetical protein
MDNLHDAVRIINESSHGMMIEYNLDFFSFLSLSQYWQFSYDYSLLRYVDGEPAAVMLACTEPESQDGFIYYWGALPKFWRQPVALPLFETCCQRLHHDGYKTLYGVAAPDRPSKRYRFIKSQAQHTLLELKASSLHLPPRDDRFQIRALALEDVAHLAAPNEPVHWCQRPNFMRRVAHFLQWFGAFDASGLQAYVAVMHQSDGSILADIRSQNGSDSAGHELLRWLSDHDFRFPLTAATVIEGTYAERLLTSAGFTRHKQLTTLSRDLPSTCKPLAAPASL